MEMKSYRATFRTLPISEIWQQFTKMSTPNFISQRGASLMQRLAKEMEKEKVMKANQIKRRRSMM